MVSEDMLRRFPYFTGASNLTLTHLCRMAELKQVREGTRLFKSGEKAKALQILLSGEVEVYLDLPELGKVVVDSVMAGELIQWSAVVEPYITTASARATCDCEIISVPGDELRKRCEVDNALGFRMMNQVASALSSRLRGVYVQLASLR